MGTTSSTSNDKAAANGILLFVVSDVFDITGVGCILILGIPHSSDSVPSIQRGAPIVLRRPDDSEIQTVIRQFELIRMASPKPFVPISLPRNFKKSDVPSGTEVWLCPTAEPNSNATGNT